MTDHLNQDWVFCWVSSHSLFVRSLFQRSLTSISRAYYLGKNPVCMLHTVIVELSCSRKWYCCFCSSGIVLINLYTAVQTSKLLPADLRLPVLSGLCEFCPWRSVVLCLIQKGASSCILSFIPQKDQNTLWICNPRTNPKPMILHC